MDETLEAMGVNYIAASAMGNGSITNATYVSLRCPVLKRLEVAITGTPWLLRRTALRRDPLTSEAGGSHLLQSRHLSALPAHFRL